MLLVDFSQWDIMAKYSVWLAMIKPAQKLLNILKKKMLKPLALLIEDRITTVKTRMLASRETNSR